MIMRPRLFAFSWGMVLSSLLTARAQIDPFKRELIQMGYSQATEKRTQRRTLQSQR